jgi:two-component system response regulator RegX3
MNSLDCAGEPNLGVALRARRNCTDAALGAMRVAIVADDPFEAALLSHWLVQAGHRCHHFDSGGALIRVFDQVGLDAVVLDWNLPDVSGADVLRRIRGSDRASLPVLFVSGQRREHDVVSALRQGADDYMVKPVGGAELLARLDAILRRGRHRVEAPAMVELDAYRIDCQSRVVLRDGRPVEMTAKDFELSVLFLRNVGRLLSRGYVMDRVWPKALISSRTLDTHVSRLRKKLGWTPEYGWRLEAAYGRGYRLDQLRAARGDTVRHRQVST